jgi:hypothetical protein
MQQPGRTLPEKTNGNTFERTGGTAMRTVAFHFKVNIDVLCKERIAVRCVLCLILFIQNSLS